MRKLVLALAAITALGASAGSLLGLVAGVYVGGGPFYDATGCCGDGWLSALILGAAGGSAGSATGAVLVGRHPWSRAVPASVLAAGVGIQAGAAGGLLGDLPGALLGFSLGQGITTAVMAPEP